MPNACGEGFPASKEEVRRSNPRPGNPLAGEPHNTTRMFDGRGGLWREMAARVLRFPRLRVAQLERWGRGTRNT